jgi:release factor glutamine methyltransferase
VTVLEALQKSVEFLVKKGVDSPRLQAELLLAHALGVARMRLYLDFERVLTNGQVNQYRELIRRRGQREPLQQITGSASFCGLEIRLNRAVLVPRPETELLAEAGWKVLQTLATRAASPAPQALDFGTGSGCLAIALAVKCPTARICALDVSPEALAVAEQNAAAHGISDRIRFVLSLGFAAVSVDTRVDLIVGNPPYVATAEIDTLQPEVRDFEPRLALDGGADGLRFYREIAAAGKQFLCPGGKVLLEFGDGQGTAVEKIFSEQNWIVEELKQDYTQRPRILVARRS